MNVDRRVKSYFARIDVAAVCVNVRVVSDECCHSDIRGSSNRTARITRLYG